MSLQWNRAGMLKTRFFIYLFMYLFIHFLQANGGYSPQAAWLYETLIIRLYKRVSKPK